MQDYHLFNFEGCIEKAITVHLVSILSLPARSPRRMLEAPERGLRVMVEMGPPSPKIGNSSGIPTRWVGQLMIEIITDRAQEQDGSDVTGARSHEALRAKARVALLPDRLASINSRLDYHEIGYFYPESTTYNEENGMDMTMLNYNFAVDIDPTLIS